MNIFWQIRESGDRPSDHRTSNMRPRAAERAKRWEIEKQAGRNNRQFRDLERERIALQCEVIDREIDRWLNRCFDKLWNRYRLTREDVRDDFSDIEFGVDDLARNGVPDKVVRTLKAGLETWRAQVGITNSLTSYILGQMPGRPANAYKFIRACGFPVLILTTPLDLLDCNPSEASFDNVQQAIKTAGQFTPEEVVHFGGSHGDIRSSIIRAIITPEPVMFQTIGINGGKRQSTFETTSKTGGYIKLTDENEIIWIEGSDFVLKWEHTYHNINGVSTPINLTVFNSSTKEAIYYQTRGMSETDLAELQSKLGVAKLKIKNGVLDISLKKNQMAIKASKRNRLSDSWSTLLDYPALMQILKHELFHAFADLYRPVRRKIPVLENCRMASGVYNTGALVNELSKVSAIIAEEILWRIDDNFTVGQIVKVMREFYSPHQGITGHESTEVVEAWLEEMELKWDSPIIQNALNILVIKMVQQCAAMKRLGYANRQIMLRLIRYPVSEWQRIVKRSTLADEIAKDRAPSITTREYKT